MNLMRADSWLTYLSPKKRLIQIFTYPLWTLCELSCWFVRPKQLSPHENTQRCYETLLDPLCAKTGTWPDFTEGYYPTGKEDYEDAQTMQFDFILDRCGCGPGTQVLDIGCGNGKLLKRAMDRGCSAHGITIAQTQVEECRSQHINAILCHYEDIETYFSQHQFDVIILNGSSEHFATAQDAMNGQSEQIYRRLFNIIHHVLKPGGKVFITCIHFRVDTEAKRALLHPVLQRYGSYYFYCSLLIHFFSGWYPHEGEFEKVAGEVGLQLVYERDATHDYLLTSIEWGRRLRNLIRDDKRSAISFFYSFFLKDPRYFFIAFMYWLYGAWTWQFTGGEQSPMKHRWLMFKSSK